MGESGREKPQVLQRGGAVPQKRERWRQEVMTVCMKSVKIQHSQGKPYTTCVWDVVRAAQLWIQ